LIKEGMNAAKSQLNDPRNIAAALNAANQAQTKLNSA
jgi:hypothetical protein